MMPAFRSWALQLQHSAGVPQSGRQLTFQAHNLYPGEPTSTASTQQCAALWTTKQQASSRASPPIEGQRPLCWRGLCTVSTGPCISLWSSALARHALIKQSSRLRRRGCAGGGPRQPVSCKTDSTDHIFPAGSLPACHAAGSPPMLAAGTRRTVRSCHSRLTAGWPRQGSQQKAVAAQQRQGRSLHREWLWAEEAADEDGDAAKNVCSASLTLQHSLGPAECIETGKHPWSQTHPLRAHAHIGTCVSVVCGARWSFPAAHRWSLVLDAAPAVTPPPSPTSYLPPSQACWLLLLWACDGSLLRAHSA